MIELQFFRDVDSDTGDVVYYAVLSRQLGADWYECLRLNPDGDTEPVRQNILWLRDTTQLDRERMSRIDADFVKEATRQHLAAHVPQPVRE
jgi:hypothetical protein